VILQPGDEAVSLGAEFPGGLKGGLIAALAAVGGLPERAGVGVAASSSSTRGMIPKAAACQSLPTRALRWTRSRATFQHP
jgi:hypothetical protein